MNAKAFNFLNNIRKNIHKLPEMKPALDLKAAGMYFVTYS
jgi:hypothetical protein